MKLSAKTKKILAEIRANFSNIAQEIFEEFLLQPFKGSPKTNLYALPIERVSHGVQHASRVALYIPLLINFFRSINSPYTAKLSEDEITLLQIAALCHDAARKNDYQDEWEAESAEIFINFLKKKGIMEAAAHKFSLYITREKENFLNAVLQSADSIDIMRTKKELKLELVNLFFYLTSNDREKFIDLITDIRQFIADQYDLKHACQITLRNGVIRNTIAATRNPQEPTLKQKYEHANRGYGIQEELLKNYVNLYCIYEGKIIISKTQPLSGLSNLKAAHIFKSAAQAGYYLTFEKEDQAKECLAQIKTLIEKEIPSIKHAKVSKYSYKETTTPYRFLIMIDQWNLLKNKIRAAAPVLKPTGDYYFKSIRGDIYNYYFKFIHELLDPKIRYVKRPGPKKSITVRGDGIYARNATLAARFALPLKPAQYTAKEKSGYTKFQSTSLGMPNFFPPVFGFSNRASILCGFMFNAKHVLLSQRVYIYDDGTINKPYDHWDKNAALLYKARLDRDKLLYSESQFNAFRAFIIQNTNPQKHNEALTRLKFICDESVAYFDRDKVFIASDNLESRLLAKQYATVLLKRLKREKKCADDYQIPICFYNPKEPDLLFKEYTEDEYQIDRLNARLIYLDKNLRQDKYANNNYEFLFALTPAEIIKELSQETSKSFILHLLSNGYVHIVKILSEIAGFDLNEFIGRQQIISKYDIKKIIIHLIRDEDEKYAISVLMNAIKVFGDQFDYSTLLPLAVEKNLKKLVKKLLKNANIDVNESVICTTIGNQETISSLQIAAILGYEEIVKELLKSPKIDVNALSSITNRPSLFSAAKYGYPNIVKLLCDFPNTNINFMGVDQRTALKIAIEYGQVEVVKVLLEAKKLKFSNNMENPLNLATTNGDVEIVKLLLTHRKIKPTIDMFLKAIEKGQLEMLKALLNGPPKWVLLNIQLGDLLHFSMHHKQAEIVKFLTTDDKIIQCPTLLRAAITYNYYDILISLLKDPRVDVNALFSNDRTPLSHAIQMHNYKSFFLLLGHPSIDINQADGKGKLPIMYAMDKGVDHIIFDTLMKEKRLEINAVSSKGTVLYYAACDNLKNARIYSLLADKNVDVTLAFKNDVEKASNLFVNIMKNPDKKIFDATLHKFGPLFKEFNYLPSPLLNAVKAGDISSVEFMLENNININIKNKRDENALHLAIDRENEAMVKLLLSNKLINLNVVNKKGNAPLHWAIQSKNIEIIKMLAEDKRINVNIPNEFLNSPLELAIMNGGVEIISLLLKNKSLSLDKPEGSLSLLESVAKMAFKSDSLVAMNILNLLLEDKRSDVKSSFKNSLQFVSDFLCFAISKLDNTIALFLLSKFSVLFTQMNFSSRPLMEAIEKGNLDYIKLMLENGISVVNKNEKDETILQLAIQHQDKDIEIIKLISLHMLHHNIPITKNDLKLLLPLLLHHLEIDIIKNIFMVDPKNINELCHLAFSEAIRSNQQKTITHILSIKQYVIEPQEFYSLLKEAITQKNIELFNKLLSREDINVNQLYLENKNTTSLLFKAIEEGHIELIDKLLSYEKINVNLPCAPGITPLFFAIQSKQHSIVKALLNHLEIDVNGSAASGKNPLLLAVQQGDNETVKALLSHNKIDMSLVPALLCVAAQLGHHKIVKSLLIDNRCDINQRRKEGGPTALYLAAREGHLKIVKTLLERNADVNLGCNNGVGIITPLKIAKQNGHDEVAQIIDQYINRQKLEALQKLPDSYFEKSGTFFGIKINALIKNKKSLIEKEKIALKTALQDQSELCIAAKEGNLTKVKQIINSHPEDINKPRWDGLSPLYFAAQAGELDVVKRLLKVKNINVDLPSPSGATPLFIAAQQGHLEVVKVLVGNEPQQDFDFVVIEDLPRANINQRRNDGATPLFIAAQKGHKDIVDFLLSKGANKEVGYNNGFIKLNPVQIAEKQGHTEVVNTIKKTN